MKASKITGKDLLLLLLYSPATTDSANEPVKGRTRLTKMIFIFREELYRKFRFDKIIDEGDLPEFFSWNFGPFSKDVYDYIEFFKRIGFIEVSASVEDTLLEEAEEYFYWEENLTLDDQGEKSTEHAEEEFRLSETGQRYVRENLYDALSSNQKKMLKTFKRGMNTAPLFKILRYVYRKYPETIERSRIKDRL